MHDLLHILALAPYSHRDDSTQTVNNDSVFDSSSGIYKDGEISGLDGLRIQNISKDNSMTIKHHIAATIAISSIIYFSFNSLAAFISSLIGGILIDLDHLLEFYIREGFSLKIQKFFRWCYENEWQRIVLFIHSVELMFILWLVISIFKLGIFWIGFAVGITQHMILDIIFNSRKMKVFSYFFIYRLANGFKKEKMFRKEWLEQIT